MAQQADGRSAERPPPRARESSPTPPQRPGFRLSPRWIVFFLAVLALNLFISTRAMDPESRVRVPYSPFFLQQVRASNVEEIRSKGTDIQGTFSRRVTFDDSVPNGDSRLRQYRRALPAAPRERRQCQRRAA